MQVIAGCQPLTLGPHRGSGKNRKLEHVAADGDNLSLSALGDPLSLLLQQLFNKSQIAFELQGLNPAGSQLGHGPFYLINRLL